MKNNEIIYMFFCRLILVINTSESSLDNFFYVKTFDTLKHSEEYMHAVIYVSYMYLICIYIYICKSDQVGRLSCGSVSCDL